MSDCLVSVGGKLWRFALTVNLKEFLMELQSCQTSKCCAYLFIFSSGKNDVTGVDPYTTLCSVIRRKTSLAHVLRCATETIPSLDKKHISM